MYWVCVSDVLIAFHFRFTAVLFISSSLFISMLRGLHQKVSTCPVCFGFRYNSKVSDYHDFFALSFPFSFLFPFPSLALCRRGKKSTILPQTGVILPCLGPLIFNSTVLQVCLCHYFSDLFVLHPASACLLLSGFKQNFSLLTRIIFGTCKIFLLYCSLPVQLQWAAWFRRITCWGKERLQHPQQS